MRVMVTGGSGFVGSHTVRALRQKGHAVRLLVRSPEKLAGIFGSEAGGVPDHVVGDVTDPQAVARAMRDCDAVFHAAAVVALEARRAQEVLATNLRGVEIVVGGARERGIPRIVYVSSVGALFDGGPDSITADAPVARSANAYGQSKAAAERLVRGLQEAGAPIQCIYPSGVLGPDDPGLSEGNHTLRICVRDLMVCTSSGFQAVDVRDLADLHVRALEAQAPSGRYVAAGPCLPWRELAALLEELTGRRLRRISLPGSVLRAAGRAGDWIKRVYPFDFPLTHEAMRFATQWPGADARATTTQLGVTFRSPAATYSDALCWMLRAGHLDARHVGRLADPRPP